MQPFLSMKTCGKCGVAVSATTETCQKCKDGAPIGTKVILKTWNADSGRRFKETGEFRQARAGEFILAPLGVAQANNLTKEKFRILKEVASATPDA